MPRRLHKLIWSEGMYLTPHHFQAQSRFFEDSIHFVADCFRHFNYGYVALEVDEGELRQGSVLVHQARGVMPDGLVFEIAEKEDLPPFLRVEETFPDTGAALMLYLAVSAFDEARGNVSTAGTNGQSVRFRTSETEVPDYNTGNHLRPITLLKPNLRIATEGELTTQDTTLPLVRVLRNGKGQFVADPAYIPPCLQMAASPRLQFLLERLLEVVTDKSRSLAERRRRSPAAGLRGDPTELMEFWLLHAVNSAIPLLRLWKTGKSPHPGRVYAGLCQLAGALCTFAPGSEPMSLPLYNHGDPGGCFAVLDDHIQRHLELGSPTNCISIPLEKSHDLFFTGKISDSRCFDPSRWVLGIRADLSESALIAQVPALLKVSAAEWIERVVRQAVPGAPLTYLAVPPASVPVEFGVVYFTIDNTNRLFDPVRAQHSIGIYIPSEVANAEVQVHVVLGRPAA